MYAHVHDTYVHRYVYIRAGAYVYVPFICKCVYIHAYANVHALVCIHGHTCT